jgi:hypothetical protein
MNNRISINVLYGVVFFDHRKYESKGGIVLHSVHLTKKAATDDKRRLKHHHKTGGLSTWCCFGYKVVAFRRKEL